MSDEQGFRFFLSQTRERARAFTGLEHISADVRDVLKDFIEVANQTEKLLSARTDSNADHRILQKKMEALKVEHRETQKALERLKSTLTSDLVPTLKVFTSEAAALDAQSDKFPQAGLKQTSQRLKAGIASLVEMIKKLSA